MGGLFGDTVVGSLLTFIPIPASDGILAITVTFLVLTIILNIFCSGFIGSEIKKIIEFLYNSSKITCSLLSLLIIKLISSINKKAFGKDSDRNLNRNLADAYEETFLPKAPNYSR